MKSKHIIIAKALRLCSIIIFFSGIANSLFAKRDATADLTYTHISGNLYRFHCTYYRDCLGIPAPTFITMTLSSVQRGINQNITLNQLPISAVVITNNCPSSVSVCAGGSQPGIEKYQYEADVNIPGQYPDWIFSVSDCCLNSAITTIQNPNSDEAYAEARLNNQFNDNSSPQFTNDPIVFIINQNQDFYYNNGMVDPDGDSLVYSLIHARTSANTNVVYNPGYNFLNPLSSVPNTTFNEQTGDLFIHPDLNECGLIAFLIEDFRNGVLLGSVMREVIMFISPTSNQNPTLSGMDGTMQHVTAVFPGSLLCFNIFSNDIDVGDILTVTWNNTIPTSTFTTAGSPHPTGTFCWTPTIADVRSQPYTFTSTVKDNACPFNNVGVYSYSIYVTLDSTMVNAPSNFQSNLVDISPNPSSGVFTIYSTEKFSQLKVFNALGACVLRKDFDNRIDLSSQPSGIYFVEVETANGRLIRQKLVKE